MLIEIKNISGNVIYSSEAVSLAACLENAVRDMANLGDAYLGGAYLGGAYLGGAYLGGANLRGANLGGAYLGGAYLGGANLGTANLRGANLRGANLGTANLRGANLRGANLGGAYLGGANLGGANLGGANLGEDIKIQEQPIQVSTPRYDVIVFDNHMKIGCEFHSLSGWWGFDDKRILQMDGKVALEFWRKWKGPLQAICAAEGRV